MQRQYKKISIAKIRALLAATSLVLMIAATPTALVLAAPNLNSGPAPAPPATPAAGTCGDNTHGGAYKPSIDIGCKGKGNPIADALFAIIRILSDGVGLVVIGSIIVGGMQYTGSRGDPQSTARATQRIRSSFFALLLFLFGYAILNYIIPGQFLQ